MYRNYLDLGFFAAVNDELLCGVAQAVLKTVARDAAFQFVREFFGNIDRLLRF